MYHHTNIHTHLYSMKTAASSSICLCKHCAIIWMQFFCMQLSIRHSCQLSKIFCTLPMIHDPFHPCSPICFLEKCIWPNPVLVVDIATPTHCTNVKDTVHRCSVTYMQLVWRTFEWSFLSYKNGANSNSQYLAVQHVLFIYRDGTMALARTSGHVLANHDNIAVFWSRYK